LLTAAARGLTNAETSAELYLSLSTTKTYAAISWKSSPSRIGYS
jgi:DNA-binding NarL/FixJ family response regulator